MWQITPNLYVQTLVLFVEEEESQLVGINGYLKKIIKHHNMKVSELVYSILDLSKASTSDDSYYTEELVIFLLKKYRSFLIKKEQDKEKSSQDIASEFEYQQICLNLEKTPDIDGEPCTGGYYLRTAQKIPKILEGTQPRVYPIDYFQGINITYVSRDRMRYVGNNPYLKNIHYVAIGPDFHLYMKSQNPQFLYMKKLRMSALFEDIDEAAGLLCDSNGESQSCDVLDMEFPIRDYLVPTLIEMVVNELVGAAYKPADRVNNANDDLSDLVTFIRKNVKSALQKQIEE